MSSPLEVELMNRDISRHCKLRSTMSQDRLEALLLVSFEKDILLALTI